jgi:hypothetical protein
MTSGRINLFYQNDILTRRYKQHHNQINGVRFIGKFDVPHIRLNV